MSSIDVNLSGIVFEQKVVYKECRHNLAAKHGLVFHDGCLEFVKDTTNDAMLCVACGCHQNFHRRHIVYNPTTLPHVTNNNMNATRSSLVGPIVQFHPSGSKPPMKKRRTRFTSEQRNQLMTFAEGFGWKPQMANKEEIQRFCSEMGITHKILMVWLNNNRHRATHKN
ncbi:ZF-HD homeobox protein, Cys/His-rich dimerization domain [Sesbania bispinosa]|nr:ZF-HD homeobox protein, Cys/His-rich dimerization domain [Sesbania bispinosa]